MDINPDDGILTHTSSTNKKIDWIKAWVVTGHPTLFHEICTLQCHASKQCYSDYRLPNVTWGLHMDEEVLNVDGLKVHWSGWNRLYTNLIEKIKNNLKSVTFNPTHPPSSK